jgi:hypothetical protein
MNSIAHRTTTIPAMSDEAISKVQKLQDIVASAEQAVFETQHVIHDGVYSRTMMLPAGHVLVGALLKVPTTLIVNGDCVGYIGDEIVHLSGHAVLAASARRKQVFVANTDTWLTMILKTDLKDIESIENYFTDEATLLASRQENNLNKVTITEVEI